MPRRAVPRSADQDLAGSLGYGETEVVPGLRVPPYQLGGLAPSAGGAGEHEGPAGTVHVTRLADNRLGPDAATENPKKPPTGASSGRNSATLRQP